MAGGVRPWTALVMAGRRGGAADPLAEARGTSHRALLPVAGVPMLVRVVRALRASTRVGAILISIDAPEALRESAELAALLDAGEIEAFTSATSPSRSVLDILEGPARGQPVLVTTADHALLRTEWVDHFADASAEAGADVTIALVGARVHEARFPNARRTWIRLRDDRWSGANLFTFRTPAARRAAEFWVRAEQHRKRPWRLIGAFGPVSLVLFLLGRFDLESGFERISRAMGTLVRAVPLPFAEAAIDVDRPSDLEIAEQLLGERGDASAAPAPAPGATQAPAGPTAVARSRA